MCRFFKQGYLPAWCFGQRTQRGFDQLVRCTFKPLQNAGSMSSNCGASGVNDTEIVGLSIFLPRHVSTSSSFLFRADTSHLFFSEQIQLKQYLFFISCMAHETSWVAAATVGCRGDGGSPRRRIEFLNNLVSLLFACHYALRYRPDSTPQAV